MGRGRSLLKNTLALSIPNLVNPVINFALILVISRHLGTLGLGQYSLVLSYVELFGTFAALGIGSLIVRDVARNPEMLHSTFVHAGILGLASSFVALIVMNAVVAGLGYDRVIFLSCAIMSLSLFGVTGVKYLESLFRAMEKSEYYAYTYLAENALRVAVSVVVVVLGYGMVNLFAATLGVRMLGFVFFLVCYLRVFGKPRAAIEPDIWRRLLRQAPVFFSIALFSSIHLSIDSIMLSKLKSIESVGVYNAADRILSISKTLPVAFSAALLPVLTQEYGLGVERLQALTGRSLKYLCLGAFPLVVGTAVLAEPIILLLYGERFHAAVMVLRCHIISLIPFAMAFLLAEVLIATDNQNADLAFNALAVVMNTVLNLLLIPRWAELGAVFATLTTIVVFNQLQYWFLKRRVCSVPCFQVMPRIVLAAAGMGAVTALMKGYHLALVVGVSVLVYGLLIHLLRVLDAEEIQFFKDLVKNRSESRG